MKITKILITLSLVIAAEAQSVSTFWNDYPDCERQCHQTVYENQSCILQNNCECSGCLCLADSCLCETSSWLIAVSQCIGQQCGSSAVSDAATIASAACAGNGYPLAVSEQSLIAAGLAVLPSTSVNNIVSTTQTETTASQTSTEATSPQSTQSSITPAMTFSASPSNSSGNSSGGHKGLSTALIAVITILAVLFAACLVVGLLYLRHKRREAKRDQERIHNLRNNENRSDIDDPDYQKTVITDASDIRSASIAGWVNGVNETVELHEMPREPQGMSMISGATLTTSS